MILFFHFNKRKWLISATLTHDPVSSAWLRLKLGSCPLGGWVGRAWPGLFLSLREALYGNGSITPNTRIATMCQALLLTAGVNAVN